MLSRPRVQTPLKPEEAGAGLWERSTTPWTFRRRWMEGHHRELARRPQLIILLVPHLPHHFDEAGQTDHQERLRGTCLGQPIATAFSTVPK